MIGCSPTCYETLSIYLENLAPPLRSCPTVRLSVQLVIFPCANSRRRAPRSMFKQEKAALDGLVVKSPAFGTEGRRFETMKGYTPDSDMLQDDRCVRATL